MGMEGRAALQKALPNVRIIEPQTESTISSEGELPVMFKVAARRPRLSASFASGGSAPI